MRQPAVRLPLIRQLFHSPAEVESAFYSAIENADIDALDAIWSTDDAVVCVHPGAERVEGRRAVIASFADLFVDAPVLHFRIVDTLKTGNASLAVHLVREEIELDGELLGVMISTNVYQIEEGSWRMLLHHASPEPELVQEDDALVDDAFEGGFDATFDGTFHDEDESELPERVLH